MSRKLPWLAYAAVYGFCASFALPMYRDAKLAGSGLQDYFGIEAVAWAVVTTVVLPIGFFKNGFDDNALIWLFGVMHLLGHVGFIGACVQVQRGRAPSARWFAMSSCAGGVISVFYVSRGAFPLVGYWLWLASLFSLLWVTHRTVRDAAAVGSGPTSERHSS